MRSKKELQKYKTFFRQVSNYLLDEYSWGTKETLSLTTDEQDAISMIIKAHFESKNSINNSANDVINYIRCSREWMENNL